MAQNPRTIAAAIVVLALLIVSTLGAFALVGSGTSHANGSAPAISAGLTMAVGPTCTATVSGENSQHTAIQRVIVTYSSTPGAVICISPGTYPEQLTINGTTDLTLWGSGNTSTILSPPSVVVNQVDLDSGLATYAILGAFDDSGLTVANLAINGTSSASSAVGCAAFNGIYFANSSGTIENTTITGINQNDGCQGQNAVVVNNGYFTTQSAVALSVSIRDNTVLGYGKNGITCNDPGVDCAIAGNTVATTAMASGFSATNGIQLYGANGTILNNSVSGNDYLPSWCAGGNYFFAGSGPCSGNSLAQATGILLYAPGNGVNVSGNSLTGNQIGVADIGGPMSAWHNTVRSAGFYGMVLDFNATPGWLGSAVYASGPYTGTVGENAVRNSNVGVLVYDDNASLLSNVLSNVNVSFEVATDLPVGYSVQLQDNNATSNVSGALLGDVSSFQPGVASYPVGNFTLLGNAFVNGSTSPAGGHHVFGALAYAKKAALLDNQLVHFSTGVQVILPPNGNLSASQNRLSAPVSPPDAGGVGFYAFAGNASFTNNTVTDWSWMNGPGWWPNSQDAGVFLQCLQNCSVRNNSVSNSAIGIAVISYVYGPSPAPSWPFAAPASQGPIILTGNHVSGSGAFGIALELSRGNTPNAALATTVIANNWIDSRSTGAVGLMTDEGS
ncbi:MAG: hypothetical protein L3K08_02015, partial [Thermoplasmata archaeon]|nr:hypothetical protein [Thermoplasmata archaeon]